MSWSISTELKNESEDMFTDNKLQSLMALDRSNIGNCGLTRRNQWRKHLMCWKGM